MQKNFKSGEYIQKGRIKYQGWEGSLSFFLCYQSELTSNFVLVPDTTLKIRCLGQSQWLSCCFKYYDLDGKINF